MNSIWRSLAVAICIVVIFSVFVGRLIALQALQCPAETAGGETTTAFKQMLPGLRGRICDIHNETLACDIPLRKIIIDGSRVTRSVEIVNLLAIASGLNTDTVLQKLESHRRYQVFKSHISEEKAKILMAALSSRKLQGISLEPDSVRDYPNGQILCHVLGFVGFNAAALAATGVQGIELSSDKYLQGHSGYHWIERDRTGKELVQHRGVEQPAESGSNVKLSIDLGLQSIVENELDLAVRKFTPVSAVAIMMRPATGEILALANRPNYDLNDRNHAQPDQMRNRAITDIIEPGSTFKIVTHSAAQQEKLVHPETRIFCENGHWEYCGNVLHDAHPSQELTVREALAHSSNIAAGKLGVQLGDSRLYRYIRLFGFGEKTGIDLPGEVAGLIHPVRNWSKISITHIPMGQEVGVTPIQVITAMSVIANGGSLVMPQTVHSIINSKDQVISDFAVKKVRQVIDANVARAIKVALEDVVSPKGTAKAAAVPGFKVAGKTGTAQKAGPNGSYLPGKYVVSFVGFLPADKPEFVCLVILDDAKTKPGENYGGLVAAPVFANIAKRAALYLNLEPSEAPTGRENGGGASAPAPIFVKQTLSEQNNLLD